MAEDEKNVLQVPITPLLTPLKILKQKITSLIVIIIIRIIPNNNNNITIIHVNVILIIIVAIIVHTLLKTLVFQFQIDQNII